MLPFICAYNMFLCMLQAIIQLLTPLISRYSKYNNQW